MTQVQPITNRQPPGAAARILAVLSPLLGGGSMLMLTVFMFNGAFNLVQLGLGKAGSLFFDAGLSLIFFFQHSAMVRQSFHRRLSAFARTEYHAAIFSAVSGITLMLVLIFWQVTESLATPGPAVSWGLGGLFAAAIAGFMISSRAMKGFDPFGIREIRRHIRGTPTRLIPFTVAGAYRWVRHPLYFFTLVMIWSCPSPTGDRLVFNMMWTLWIIIGAAFEELDLVAVFGDDYRNYQKRVPMLVPWRAPM